MRREREEVCRYPRYHVIATINGKAVTYVTSRESNHKRYILRDSNHTTCTSASLF